MYTLISISCKEVIVISSYSGKCDLADHLEIDASYQNLNSVEELDFSTYNISIYGRDDRHHKLEINSYKDVAKYLPYLVAIGAFSDGKSNIVLSSEDFITSEEKEHLQWKLDDIQKAVRKLKRNHTPVTEENIKANLWFSDSDETSELIRRVIEHGNKADIEDIHLPLAEYYREIWYEELLRVGYNEYEAHHWVYGWR